MKSSSVKWREQTYSYFGITLPIRSLFCHIVAGVSRDILFFGSHLKYKCRMVDWICKIFLNTYFMYQNKRTCSHIQERSKLYYYLGLQNGFSYSQRRNVTHRRLFLYITTGVQVRKFLKIVSLNIVHKINKIGNFTHIFFRKLNVHIWTIPINVLIKYSLKPLLFLSAFCDTGTVWSQFLQISK